MQTPRNEVDAPETPKDLDGIRVVGLQREKGVFNGLGVTRGDAKAVEIAFRQKPVRNCCGIAVGLGVNGLSTEDVKVYKIAFD